MYRCFVVLGVIRLIVVRKRKETVKGERDRREIERVLGRSLVDRKELDRDKDEVNTVKRWIEILEMECVDREVPQLDSQMIVNIRNGTFYYCYINHDVIDLLQHQDD